MIKQRHLYDCAVATIAMYVGDTWENIWEGLGRPAEACSISKTAEYLWDRGFDVEWKEKRMPTKKAFVVVVSLNQPPKFHAIYYDGENFFDPSPGPLTYINQNQVNLGIYGVLE